MNPRGRGGYNDFSGGGSAMGSMCNMAPAQSTNSLNSGGDGGGGDTQAVNGTNLIVNYLPQDMTDRELYALFRTCGPINTCRIMKDYKVRCTLVAANSTEILPRTGSCHFPNRTSTNVPLSSYKQRMMWCQVSTTTFDRHYSLPLEGCADGVYCLPGCTPHRIFKS